MVAVPISRGTPGNAGHNVIYYEALNNKKMSEYYNVLLII